tara:strand:- start:1372 stop:1797 length:426 start_codon:yes stop_codon:yes gene_type:complete
MKRINWNNPPQDPSGLSFADLQKMYGILYRNWVECKRNRGALQSTLTATRKGELELRKEKKVLTSRVQMISKQAAANKSFRETSGWSAAAIGSVTLSWAAFAEYGYPGPKWLFEHEIFYGFICWVATSLFAWAAKGFYGAD